MHIEVRPDITLLILPTANTEAKMKDQDPDRIQTYDPQKV